MSIMYVSTMETQSEKCTNVGLDIECKILVCMQQPHRGAPQRVLLYATLPCAIRSFLFPVCLYRKA
eukprot:m.328392 g.328392  ORF g.328392 m.328392 type:complete len:66 (-) comp20427_c0_seq11:1586-1783(-)